LIAGDSNSPFMACAQEGSDCVIYGADPGAMDALAVATDAPNARLVRYSYEQFGFRCVMREEVH
jgi:hypothetical protein